MWQAAIPPGLCAIALVIKYIVFTKTHPVRSIAFVLASGRFPEGGDVLTHGFCPQGQPQEWYATIQAMVGKLYILSLFYTL